MATYQRKDSFYQRARREGYRSRAAYKLLEVQKSHRLLRTGQRVADLGCWPGAWLQVAAEQVGPSGRVAGVDLSELEPGITNEYVFALQGDLGDPETLERLREALDGRADVVLSDAAPKLTGIRSADRAREEALLESVEAAIPALLREDGSLLMKLLEGPEARAVAGRIRRRFEHSRFLKPASSRRGTSEQYLLARRFRPERECH